MTQPTHSPGPWELCYEMGNSVIKTADGESIMCDMTYYPWVPEEEEDWRLIAAAPELLAALTECREACLSGDDHGIAVSEDVVIPSDLFERMCKAINKANGQAPDPIEGNE